MKYYTTIFFTAFVILSCSAKKEVTTDPVKIGIVSSDGITGKQNKETKKDSVKITVRSGIKVGITRPVRDLEITPSTTKNDAMLEINPQQFVPPTISEKFDHSPFNVLLQNNVTNEGVVTYEAFRKNSKALRTYIVSLGELMPDESWSKNDRLAYWMNAYNAMTVDLILRNLPVESIKDINKPWDQRLWKLGDKWYNLDEIEHQILRQLDDPRIHFGINCASYSCPPLLNKAFTAETVDAQLDFLAKRFINDSTRNTITADRIEISKIFNWFSKDFKQNGSVIDFLNQYSDIKISARAKVRYKEYNWELNN